MAKSKKAVFFSIFRKVIIVIPLIYLLPKIGSLGTDGIFMSEPISNIIGGALCFAVMYFSVYRNLGRK